MTETPAATQILQAIQAGDPKASADLLPLVYGELRKLARSLRLRVPPGETLQTTALVHEAYIRLVGKNDPGLDGRGHFFASAAQAMRQILVDQARRKAARKHGGGQQRLDVDEVDVAIEPPCEDVIALHEALENLEKEDPRAAKVVMLRYFAGLTAEETASAMGVSLSTVEREWRYARTLLFTWLAEPPSDDEA